MRQISGAVLIAVLAGCSSETEVTRPRAVVAQLLPNAQYDIVKLPSLGGTLSRGMAINSVGWVAGWSNQPDGSRRAVLWKDASIINLGTLGGPGSSTVPWPGLNDAGMVVGISQTAAVDPLDESWSCEEGGFLPGPTNLICRGFAWENDVMEKLPTLGGQHGFATGVNNLGQVVGWAETPVHDPTCVGVHVLQFRAVMLEPKKT
jgi:probable HAF family extracellular repeat protein